MKICVCIFVPHWNWENLTYIKYYIYCMSCFWVLICVVTEDMHIKSISQWSACLFCLSAAFRLVRPLQGPRDMRVMLRLENRSYIGNKLISAHNAHLQLYVSPHKFWLEGYTTRCWICVSITMPDLFLVRCMAYYFKIWIKVNNTR